LLLLSLRGNELYPTGHYTVVEAAAVSQVPSSRADGERDWMAVSGAGRWYTGGGGGEISSYRRPVSQSWLRAPFGTLDHMLALKNLCFLFSWGVIPDGMTGLSFNGSQYLCVIAIYIVLIFKITIFYFL
jgi:hypothetical protein